MDEKEGIVELEKNLKNYEREKDVYPDRLVELKNQKERLIRRVDTHEKMYPVIRENIKMVTPTREFESLDEYWECQKEILDIDHESNMQKMKQELSQYDNQIELVEKEIARINAEIPKVKKQIAELRGEAE